MNGPGHLPPSPPRASGGAIALRVVFMLIPPLTLGLVAWAPMLRIALLRRRTLDWVLLAATVVVAVCALVLAGGTPEDKWTSDVGVVLVLLLALLVPFYYLYVDLRTPQTPRPLTAGAAYARPYPYGAPAPTGFAPGPPAAYPPYGGTYGDTSYGGAPYQPAHPRPAPHQPAPHQPAAHQPAPQDVPPAARPAGPRIEQVRAELDELSDYLRKHPDGR